MTTGDAETSPPSRHALPWPASALKQFFTALFVLGVVGCGAVWALMSGLSPPLVMFAGGIALAAAVGVLPKRPRIVRVDGHLVYGLGEALPVGLNYIIIKRHEWTTHHQGTAIHHERWHVIYNGRVLVRSEDPLDARSFAEALARIVRAPLHWETDAPRLGAGTQSLLPLDAPLVDRMRELGSESVTLHEPDDANVSVALHGNAIALDSHMKPRRALLWWLGAAAVQAALTYLEIESDALRGFLGALVAIAAAIAVVSVPRAITTSRLQIDDDGVVMTRRLFGVIPLRTHRIAARDVDGLHLEDGELLVTGKGAAWFRFVVGKSREAADWARSIVASALAGDRKAAAQLPAGESMRGSSAMATAAHTAHACPRCLAKLGDTAGAFDDAMCSKCRGRFLSPSGAERLLEGELGISKEILRGILQSFAGKRLRCPGCGTHTSPARVRGVACDLCTGCGGLWLDNGELTTLTQGRHAG